MCLSPYFLRWHYPDQVREATLMDFLGYYLSRFDKLAPPQTMVKRS